MGLVPKYYLFAGDTSEVSVFFPYINNIDYLSSKLSLNI